jgi:8-oxo-dGTP diphosphatase
MRTADAPTRAGSGRGFSPDVTLNVSACARATRHRYGHGTTKPLGGVPLHCGARRGDGDRAMRVREASKLRGYGCHSKLCARRPGRLLDCSTTANASPSDMRVEAALHLLIGSLAMREQIRAELSAIQPLDELERTHLSDALAWVSSGVELCRTAKPAMPPKHLVSYLAVVDASHILLVDHRAAGLWLPAGGHVEPGEHPRATALRELHEELGIVPSHAIGPPLMVTCAVTVGAVERHTDVSLWYVIHEDRRSALHIDEREFRCVRWFAFPDIPPDRREPNLNRFISKLKSSAAEQA